MPARIARRGAVPLLGALLAASSFVAVGHAASLNQTGGAVGGARIAMSRCTTAGLAVVQTVPTTLVTSVVVSNISSGCGGATIRATVNNGTTNSSGSATVPAGGGSVTVTLAVAVAVAISDQIDIVMTGP